MFRDALLSGLLRISFQINDHVDRVIRRGWSEKRTFGFAIAAGLGFHIGLNMGFQRQEYGVPQNTPAACTQCNLHIGALFRPLLVAL